MEDVKGAIYVDEKLRLPLSERDRRWRKIRLGMALRGIDCLLVHSEEGDRYSGPMANLSYLTSLRSNGLCLFPMEHDPIAFVGTQNQFDPYNYYAVVQDWVTDVRSADSTLKGGGLTGAIECIKALGLEKARIGMVDGHEKAQTSMPYKLYDQLRAALPNAKLTDQSSLVNEARIIKSPVEIEMLRKSGKQANRMIKAMVETCREGIREIDLYNEMMKAHMDEGGDPHFFCSLASGPVNDTVHGLHGKTAPYSPTSRRIEKGDTVVVEFHSSYGGYLTAAEFTLCVGSVDPNFKHVHDVAVECFKCGTAMTRAGIPFADAVQAYREPAIREGFKWLELGLHNHGLNSGGFPSAVYPVDREKYMALFRPDGSRTNIAGFELEAGMVFGHNIDINNPAWRPNVGVMLGDTVVVTNGEPELLVGTSLDLPVV